MDVGQQHELEHELTAAGFGVLCWDRLNVLCWFPPAGPDHRYFDRCDVLARSLLLPCGGAWRQGKDIVGWFRFFGIVEDSHAL